MIVAVLLAVIVISLGTIALFVRVWRDRLAAGANKSQFQTVAILGLLSLVTFNKYLWLAALVLAAVRVPDFVPPRREIAGTLPGRMSGDAVREP